MVSACKENAVLLLQGGVFIMDEKLCVAMFTGNRSERGSAMKTKLLLASALFTLSAIGTQAESRGWGMGVGTFDGDFGIHARKDFRMGAEQQFGIALQGGFYNQQKWTTRLDGDFHYVFRPESAFSFYPLIGLDLAIQSKNNRTGFNAGIGSTIQLNSQTRLFLEAKHVFGDWDGFAVTAGIYF